MSISINPATYVITIPKTDTTYVTTNATTGYEIRSYDEYAFMREFADYLDSEAGMGLPSGFTHNTSVTISGVVYARALVILAPFTVTFEDDTYQVKLVGGMNNNLLDVLNPNNVSVIPANSAGLQTVNISGGSGATPAEIWTYGTRTLTESAGLTTTEHEQLMAIPTDNPSASEISTQVHADAQTTPIHSDVKKVNAVTVTGTGVYPDDPWGPA